MRRPMENSDMTNDIEHAIRVAIEEQPRLTTECRSVSIELHPDVLVLDGLVATIAAKRRLALLAAQNGGGLGVLDRVGVQTATQREDAEVAIDLIEALDHEPIFQNYRVLALPADAMSLPDHMASIENSTIGVAVNAGTARLLGIVASLFHRRISEVLCWWIPGVTDVNNHLYVMPSETDSDQEISNAVRIALDKDPWLNAPNVKVSTHAREVNLAGTLADAAQRHRAECDAWYVRGVHEVVNNIEIDS